MLGSGRTIPIGTTMNHSRRVEAPRVSIASRSDRVFRRATHRISHRRLRRPSIGGHTAKRRPVNDVISNVSHPFPGAVRVPASLPSGIAPIQPCKSRIAECRVPDEPIGCTQYDSSSFTFFSRPRNRGTFHELRKAGTSGAAPRWGSFRQYVSRSHCTALSTSPRRA
jgi:hypothetical protein